MGWFEHHREHKAEQAHEEWAVQVAHLRQLAKLAHGWTGDPVPLDVGIVAKRGERSYLVLANASLIEPSREWLYAKVIGFHHDDHLPWTAIAVSNRQKVSGFLYPEEQETDVRFRLELALACFSSTREQFAASIDAQVTEAVAAEPEPQPRRLHPERRVPPSWPAGWRRPARPQPATPPPPRPR